MPLVGINQGRVGFMTDIGHDDVPGRHRSPQAQYTLLLDARAEEISATARDARTVRSTRRWWAGSQARLIEFELNIDGEHVYQLRADGVIVATPTGSTAYALSAQGPILQPTVPAFALVPLNPHVLSARPVSVSDASVIEIRLVRALDARAHFDGFALTDLQEGDRLVLRRSADTIHFVHPPGYSYFRMLREKLRWSRIVGKRPED